MIKNFRDILAILLAVMVIPAIWILQGMAILTLPGEVIGVTISLETLIAQFYYRKASTSNGGSS